MFLIFQQYIFLKKFIDKLLGYILVLYNKLICLILETLCYTTFLQKRFIILLFMMHLTNVYESNLLF